MATKSTNTMAEFLQRMLGDMAIAKTLPDADLQFLIGLETTILQKLREPMDAMAGQLSGGQGAGGAGADSANSAPMPPMDPMQAMGMGGGASPSPAMAGAGVPGVMGQTPIPPDELRRMIGG